MALLALLVFTIDAGPGRGIREGFEWVSRADQFMSGIQESRSLLSPNGFDGAEIVRLLGYGAVVLPIAWVLAAIAVLRRSQSALLPLVVAAPLLAVQAGAQARFADALSMSMAVLLAWVLVELGRMSLARLGTASDRRARVIAILALPFMLGAALAAAFLLLSELNSLRR